MSETLLVRAKGSALVPDYERPKSNPTAMVGWEYTLQSDGRVGLRALSEPVKLPVRAEYLFALRAGHLEPADATTAAVAGVPFEMTTSAGLKPETKKE